MLGIPTRTEAVAADPRYAQAIRFNELLYTLTPNYTFHWAGEAAEDHLREIVNWDQEGGRRFIDGVEEKSLAAQALPLIRPEEVYAYFQFLIENHLNKLEEVKDILDVETYQRFKKIIRTFRTKAKTAYTAAPTPFQKVRVLITLARRYESLSSDRELYRSYYDLAGNMGKRDFEEGRVDSPVGKLFSAHKGIVESSDLCWDFDESCFISPASRGPQNTATAYIYVNFDPQVRYRGNTIREREHFRHEVAEKIAESGEVVINGAIYKPYMDGYLVEGDTFPELVELLAKPVTQADRMILVPEEWVTREVELITDYHQPSPKAKEGVITALLETYDVSRDFVIPSRGEQIRRLSYYLGWRR